LKLVQEAREKDLEFKKLSEATKYRKLDNFFVTPDRAQSYQKSNLITTEANLIQEKVV
jgi:hypothetical protein